MNAQRKSLDIWLIYKCVDCDTTWNSTLYSRINPKSIDPDTLEKFHANDPGLIEKYAMDIELLKRNGSEIGTADYRIIGEDIPLDSAVQLHIKSDYSSQLKLSKLLRDKLLLSRSAFDRMIEKGQITSLQGVKLRKSRLGLEAKIIMNNGE